MVFVGVVEEFEQNPSIQIPTGHNPYSNKFTGHNPIAQKPAILK